MNRSFRAFSYWHELGLVVLLAVVLLVAAALDPRFVTWEKQLSLSTGLWESAIIAVPITLIILTAGIDLSVGATMALASVTLGLLFESGFNIWLAASAAILVGLAAGMLNGAFIAFTRVHPLIITLATLSAYRGIAEGVSLARPISGFPISFTDSLSPPTLSVPPSSILFFTFAAVAAFLLWKSVPGRWILAIGHNEKTSHLSGVPVAAVKLVLYAFSGCAAGLAAVLFAARRNTAKADVGAGVELEVITAVVLGGTSIFGGRGTILGTVLGLLLLHEIRQFIGWHWQNDDLIPLATGILLIASVLLHSIFTSKND